MRATLARVKQVAPMLAAVGLCGIMVGGGSAAQYYALLLPLSLPVGAILITVSGVHVRLMPPQCACVCVCDLLSVHEPHGSPPCMITLF